MKKYFIAYSALSFAISIACSQTTAGGGGTTSGGAAASGSAGGAAVEAGGGVAVRPAPPVANSRITPQQPGSATSPQNPNGATNPSQNKNGNAAKANLGFGTNQPPFLGVNSNRAAIFTNNAGFAPTNSPIAASSNNNVSGGVNISMGRDFAASPGDQAILARLRQIMPQNATVAPTTSRPVFFSVNSGVVTLSGDVITSDARPRLASIVRQMPGVVGINDQLVVAEPAPGTFNAKPSSGISSPITPTGFSNAAPQRFPQPIGTNSNFENRSDPTRPLGSKTSSQ